MFSSKDSKGYGGISFRVHRLFSIFELVLEGYTDGKINRLVNRSIPKKILRKIDDIVELWKDVNGAEAGLLKINALRFISRATWGSDDLIESNLTLIENVVSSEMLKRIMEFYCNEKFVLRATACPAATTGVFEDTFVTIDRLISTKPTTRDIREPLRLAAEQYSTLFSTQWYNLIQEWIRITVRMGHEIGDGYSAIDTSNSALRETPCQENFPKQNEKGDRIFNALGKIFVLGQTFRGYNSLDIEMQGKVDGACGVSEEGIVVGLLKLFQKGFECIRLEQLEANCSLKIEKILNKIIAITKEKSS